MAIAFVAVSAFVPAAEELIFRGVFYRICRRHWGAVGSASITALAFALVHGEPWVLFGLIALGLLLAYIYETTSSLSACIAAHAVHNALSLGFLLREDDPLDATAGGIEIPWPAFAFSAAVLAMILYLLHKTRTR